MPRRLVHPISDRHSNVSVATSRAQPWATNGDAVHQPVRPCFSPKPPYRDGTTHLVMPPLEFLQRLAALVPRPQLHLIRFPAVLVPNAALRSQIVPDQANDAEDPPSASPRGQGQAWQSCIVQVETIRAGPTVSAPMSASLGKVDLYPKKEPAPS
jgi:hypothetical protein